MADFDPQSYLAEEQSGDTGTFDPAAYAKAPVQPAQPAAFDPAAYASAPAGAEVSPTATIPTTEKATRPPSPREAYLKETNQVTPDEISAIANKWGANAADLQSIMPYYGATVEEPDRPLVGPQEAKRAAGILGKGILMGAPQFVYKKLQDEPTRKAIDELSELAESRKTGLVKAAELAGELGSGGAALGAAHGLFGAAGAISEATAAARATRTIAESAAFGAAGGLFTSKEGEEVKQTAIGAGAGAVLGGVLAAGGPALKKLARAYGPASDEAANSVARDVEAEMGNRQAAIQRSEDLAVRVAEGEENPAAAHVFDKKAVEETAGQLAKDDVRLAQAWEANPDLALAQEEMGWSDERYLQELAHRDIQNRDSSDVVQFAKYIESKGSAPIPRTAKQIAEMQDVGTLKEAQETLADFKAKVSDEFFRKEFQAYKASQIAVELNADYIDKGGGFVSSPVSRLARMFLDGRGYLRMVDNRSGTTLERVADTLAMGKTGQITEVGNMLRATSDVRKAVTDTGLRSLSVAQLGQIERTGNLSSLTRDQQVAFKQWQDTMETLRQRANELGVPVEKIAGEKAALYIPRTQVDEAATISRLRARMDTLEFAVPGASFENGINADQLAEMQRRAPTAFSELKQGLEWLSGESMETANDLTRLSKQATNLQGLQELGSSKTSRSMAGALQQRAEEGLPDFLRENDLNKLMVRWANSTFKDAYLRDGIQQLVKNRNLLQASGDSAGAEYVSNLLKDIQGTRATPAAWVQKKRAQVVASFTTKADQAEKAGDAVAASAYRAIAENPDLPGVLSSAMYSNLLGMNPHTFVMNLTQPVLLMAPELSSGGFGWAAGKTMSGYFKTLGDLATQGPKALNRVVERNYMAPNLMANELVESFHTGLERSGLGGMARSALEKWTHVGMSLLKMSETFNRTVAMNTAESIAKDLIQGSSSAQQFLGAVGRGYAYEIQKAVQAGNAEATEKLLADYLVGKTMFHYNRTVMNELGRYMGPVFSAFSKWPSSVAADIVGDLARKGAVGGSLDTARKYLSPLFGLMALDHYVMKPKGMSPDESPRASAILGKEGLSGLAPMHSLIDVAKKGSPVAPPMVTTAFKGFASLLTGDPANWWKFTNEAASTFVPGAGFVRILDTTIPGIMGKERPEKGTTLTGRALNLVKPGAGTKLDETIQSRLGRER